MALSLVSVGQALILISVLVQLSVAVPVLERHQRHADGLFTSEYSKLMNGAAMKSYINSFLTSKRSVQESHFPNGSKDGEPEFEEACFVWLYQNFLDNSLSDNEALEATQKSHKSLCPAFSHLVSGLSEYSPKPLGRKE